MMASIQPQHDFDHRLASRGPAIASGWFGGFCSLFPLFLIGAFWGNQSDLGLIGGRPGLLLLGFVSSVVAATIICLGCAIALFLQRGVRRSHARRLSAAMFAVGVHSFWAAVGLWRISILSEHVVILVVMLLMVSALFAMLLLHELRHRGIIASPDEGVCRHCEYPIGTSPVCTECGRPVGKQA